VLQNGGRQGRYAHAPKFAENEMAKKIIVADDNAIIRKMLCPMFEAQQDYDLCAEAANGQEAITLAIGYRPDLIILDLEMPVTNRIDAAREIKQALPGVTIIHFTQYADIATGPAFRNLPVDRVVSKNDGISLIGHIGSLIPP
jgi:DNA-binding NarL/FixJ family response regulator